MAPPPTMFTRTFDEALDLIIEARNYMAHVSPRERRHASTTGTLYYSCEAFRLTSRLTQVMAWLMMQRAVQEGEVTQDEALCESNRLSGHDICLDAASIEDPRLPAALRSLLARSLSLYLRVSRLEEMTLTRIAV
jgi:regulator of CtrA degradation